MQKVHYTYKRHNPSAALFKSLIKRVNLILDDNFYFVEIGGEKRTTLITTSTANNDPRVWGEDVGEFKLRDIKVYEKLSTCFAEQAVDKKNPDNSRYCPGKELTFAMKSGRTAYFYIDLKIVTTCPCIKERRHLKI